MDGRVWRWGITDRRGATGAILAASCGSLAALPLASDGAGAQTTQPLCDGRPATIVGTDFPEPIAGTLGDDVIWAGAGPDAIDSGPGNDVVCAGEGNDSIVTGSGDDVVLAEAGIDGIKLFSGNDRGYGGPGIDAILGSSGNDRLNGGSDSDTLTGGSGNDRLKGGSGTDVMKGGSGKDRCSGGEVVNCDGKRGATKKPPGKIPVPIPFASGPDGTYSGEATDLSSGESEGASASRSPRTAG